MKNLLVGALLAVAVSAAGTPAWAVDQEDINRAVERGIESVRRTAIPAAGPWLNLNIGGTALGGLTLLECGVSVDDKDVQRIAQAVRREAPTMTYTYSVSLSILFLDRLGDPDDIPLIESLTVRLMAGQDITGGWTYECPPISDSEKRRLQANVDQRKELVGRRELPKPGVKRTVKDLPEEIRQQVADAERAVAANAASSWGASDNSNTQFAALALWVGRRQGLPVERALDRLGQRFRASQNEDGGWPYRVMPRSPNGGPPAMMQFMISRSTASMTCSGLICLAVSDASKLEVAKDRKAEAKVLDPGKDRNLTRGLQALGAVIENPKNIQLRPNWNMRPPGAGRPPQGAGQRPPGTNVPPPGMRGPAEVDGIANEGRVGGRTFYFLWSLERVAVAFDLKTIGNKDWYGWGAEILLNNQHPDGSWVGDHVSTGADTCFALLFLKRANLAGDLTAELKGRIKDPGERVIRAGGIGGDSQRGAKGGRVESGIEGGNNKPNGKPLQDPKLADSDSGRLARELLKANGARQTALLEQMRTEKGVKYTEALAVAIPQMEGEARRKARNALAERLTRMKEETLATYLQDEDAEIRRAAALACAMKESKVLIPSLISLIRDPETRVVLAAHAALKDLTGQDFGPTADASRQDRDQAALKWLRWWTKQSREK